MPLARWSVFARCCPPPGWTKKASISAASTSSFPSKTTSWLPPTLHYELVPSRSSGNFRCHPFRPPLRPPIRNPSRPNHEQHRRFWPYASCPLSALQTYLRTCLTSSLASIARALATLSTLDRTPLEVSARCQNIVALEYLLETVKPPSRSENSTESSLNMSSSEGGEIKEPANLLRPLLAALETSCRHPSGAVSQNHSRRVWQN